jgi:hypothetical protein
MEIELHPKAAKRFDELGNELLNRVVACDADESPRSDFRPDRYPMANIPEEDIAEVRVTRSIVNGIEEEVGRLFERGKGKFGLIDDGYKALMKLAEQIQTNGAFRDSTTLEFVRDVIFDWVVCQHAKPSGASLSAFLLQDAGGKIRDYEIWIPIHQFYVERPLSVGGIAVRTITGEMMDAWQAKVAVREPADEVFIREHFSRTRSRLQGCAAACVTVRAEKGKGVDVARFQAERVAAFLRFFSPTNWTPKLRSYCVLLGSENIVQTAELFVEGGSVVNYERGVLDGRQPGWLLANSVLEQFSGLLEQLSRLLLPGNRTAYQETLCDALLLYSRNSVAVEPSDKLVYILVALESILLRNDTEPIMKSLGERMAFLIGKDIESRKAIIANVAEAYRLRSAFVHHGHSVSDLDILSTFMLNAWTCFHNLVFHQDRLDSKDQLIAALEERKLA